MTMLAGGDGPFAAVGAEDRYGDRDKWIPFVAVNDVDAAATRASPSAHRCLARRLAVPRVSSPSCAIWAGQPRVVAGAPDGGSPARYRSAPTAVGAAARRPAAIRGASAFERRSASTTPAGASR
jgi:hypothetical protein